MRHLHNVAEHGETSCLDNSRKVWLPGCPPHLIIPEMDFAVMSLTLLAELIEFLVPALETMASEATSLGLELN